MNSLRLFKFSLFTLTTIAVALPAVAQKAKDTLRIAFEHPIS